MEKERINQKNASRIIQQKQNLGTNTIVDNRPYSSFPFFSNPTAQRVSEEDEETMHGKFDSSVQRMEDEDEETLQGKFESPVQRASEEDEDTLQGKFDKPIQKKNETGMPDNLKAGIESLSGFSMDDVRVHYNSSKPATVQALAYTQGTDIHVAPGQEKHLPHEAWHVAQQMAGRVSPTTNINGMPVNDNAELEHEADVMGEKALTQRKECRHSLPLKGDNVLTNAIQCVTDDELTKNGWIKKNDFWTKSNAKITSCSKKTIENLFEQITIRNPQAKLSTTSAHSNIFNTIGWRLDNQGASAEFEGYYNYQVQIGKESYSCVLSTGVDVDWDTFINAHSYSSRNKVNVLIK